MISRRQIRSGCRKAVFALFFFGMYGLIRQHSKKHLTTEIAVNKPLCSFDLIREHCVKEKYFPTGGHWINTKGNHMMGSYVPDICRFSEPVFEINTIQHCLQRRKVTRMLFLGDSNGMKYFEETIKLFNQTFSCKLKKEHRSPDFLPDVSYFTRGTGLNASDIVVHYRDCRQCYETLVVCTNESHGDNFIVELEFLAMEYFIDTEVTTVRTKKQNNIGRAGWHHSTSTQEFIFSEYLKRKRYPDVIFVFSSNHDKARNELKKMRADMEYLKAVINMYVPLSTKLFWFSILSEDNNKKPNTYRYRKYEKQYDANSYIQLTNKHLFDVLMPEFTKSDSVINPFFDIYSMSIGILDWSTDGIHRQRRWYRAVMSRWLQMFCVN